MFNMRVLCISPSMAMCIPIQEGYERNRLKEREGRDDDPVLNTNSHLWWACYQIHMWSCTHFAKMFIKNFKEETLVTDVSVVEIAIFLHQGLIGGLTRVLTITNHTVCFKKLTFLQKIYQMRRIWRVIFLLFGWKECDQMIGFETNGFE